MFTPNRSAALLAAWVCLATLLPVTFAPAQDAPAGGNLQSLQQLTPPQARQVLLSLTLDLLAKPTDPEAQRAVVNGFGLFIGRARAAQQDPTDLLADVPDDEVAKLREALVVCRTQERRATFASLQERYEMHLTRYNKADRDGYRQEVDALCQDWPGAEVYELRARLCDDDDDRESAVRCWRLAAVLNLYESRLVPDTVLEKPWTFAVMGFSQIAQAQLDQQELTPVQSLMVQARKAQLAEGSTRAYDAYRQVEAADQGNLSQAAALRRKTIEAVNGEGLKRGMTVRVIELLDKDPAGLPEAERLLTYVLEMTPESDWSDRHLLHQWQARVYMGLKQEKPLMAALDLLESKDAFDPAMHQYRAQWWLSQGDQARALFFLNGAARGRRAEEVPAGAAREAAQQRDALEQQMGEQATTQAYDTVTTDYYKQGRHAGALIAMLDRLLAQPNVKAAPLLMYRGDAYYWLKNYPQALADFERSAELSGKPIISAPVAECCFQLGRHAQAADVFSRTIENRKAAGKESPPFWHLRLAQCQIVLKQFDAAAASLESAQAGQDPRAPKELRQMVRGDLLMAKGEKDAALTVWREALDGLMFSPYVAELEKRIHDAGGATLAEERSRQNLELLMKTLKDQPKP